MGIISCQIQCCRCPGEIISSSDSPWSKLLKGILQCSHSVSLEVPEAGGSWHFILLSSFLGQHSFQTQMMAVCISWEERTKKA